MLGGLTAYAIGALAFHSVGVPLLGLLGISHQELARFETLFATKGWIVILLGSMPILSSKLTALAAGAFGFPVMEFLLVSFLIRGTRFLSMGFVLRYGSPYLRRWLRRNEPDVVSAG
jgi:membrane protein YqaA with SNARE-associated domain